MGGNLCGDHPQPSLGVIKAKHFTRIKIKIERKEFSVELLRKKNYVIVLLPSTIR